MTNHSVEIDEVGVATLALLMQAWGCGPGDWIGDGEHEQRVRVCRSSAHDHAYYGEHCGFAGNAAGLAVVAVTNVQNRRATTLPPARECRPCADTHPHDGCADVGCTHDCQGWIDAPAATPPGETS